MTKALPNKKPRNTTHEVVLSTDAELLEEVRSTLQRCAYFRTMNPQFLINLLAGATYLEVPANTLLIQVGTTAAEIYILLRGNAGIYTGNKAILRLSEPGDIIGEFALVSTAPRSVDVRTDTAAELVRISVTKARDTQASQQEVVQFLNAITHILAIKLQETSLKAQLYQDAIKNAQEMASSKSQMEGEIRNRQQQVMLYSKVVELSNDPVVITDTDNLVQRANARAAEVFGVDLDKLTGQKVGNLLRHFQLGGFDPDSTTPPWSGEWSTGMEDKQQVFYTSISPVLGSDGATIATSYQMRDISTERAQERAIALKNEEIRKTLADLEQTYNELQRSDRLKTETLTVISNELRAPIQKILNHANKLIEQFSDPPAPQALTHINEVQEQGVYLRTIATNIDHLIDLQEDPVSSPEQAFNLNEVLTGICQELTSKAQHRRVNLRLTPSPEPITLGGDSQQFKVMLNLLLEQALMVTQPGTELVIDTYLMDITEQVHLEVRYIGPSLMNMPTNLKNEDQVNLILGLPLARKVISRHQGTLQFLQDGNTTRIWVLLPRMQKQGTQRPSRIIIADERETDRIIARGVIKNLWPASVILETTDPFELMESYEDFKPDLVIADPNITQPGWSNHRIIASLTQNRHHVCPVLTVSGLYQDFAERTLAIERGVSDYLSKPYSIFDLQFKINTLIESHRKEESLHQDMALAHRQAFTDGLTKLANRKSLDGFLATQVNYAKQTGKPCSLIMIDVDHFKVYNDTNGHQLGDEVLKGISRILAKSVRSSDLPARYGGEEFTIVLPETQKEMAVVIAEKVRRSIMDHDFPRGGRQPMGHVSASLGVSTCSEDGDTVEELLKAADDCLYVAKKQGRNRVIRAPASASQGDIDVA